AQLRRRFVEINQTRRADSLEIAAIRREIQIRLENFVLRVMSLQLEGAQDLFELSRECPGVKMKSQPRQLHRDCRSTGGRVMKSREINCATSERDRIYARMLRIIFVFVTQRRVDQVRRNFPKRSPDPEFLIGSKRNSQ